MQSSILANRLLYSDLPLAAKHRFICFFTLIKMGGRGHFEALTH